jgi:subtilase family serine protease
LPNSPSDVSRPLPPYDSIPETRRETKSAGRVLLVALGVALIAGCASAGGSSSAVPDMRTAQNISRALPGATLPPSADNAPCAAHGPNASCPVTKNQGFPPSKSPTGGLTPAQLRAAYGLPPSTGAGTPSGPAVAIVVAFKNAHAESDLATYRSQFGLPACTSANRCFQEVDSKPQPGADTTKATPNSTDGTSWADEGALDLAMVSAACPTCRIIFVEAPGEDLDSLSSAVNLAASLHPAAISNSWGVSEAGNDMLIDFTARGAFQHPGIAITASAGDLGPNDIQFPASSPYVTSVGGTSLAAAPGARKWNETVWDASSNGCSSLIARPSWQTSDNCTGARSVPDVSMLADTTPGVAVYSQAEKGWVVLGGTSIGAPFVAGLYAAAANYGADTVGAPALYAHLNALNAVPGTTGSPNGLEGF